MNDPVSGNSEPWASGMHPESRVRVSRNHRWIDILAKDLQADDYLQAGVDGTGWHLKAVTQVKTADAGWQLELESGESFRCADGSILAGIAGPHLPSDKGASPAVLFIRHRLHMTRARRRFLVSLLNRDAAPPALASIFAKPALSRSDSDSKVYYTFEEAARFLERCAKVAPAVPRFSGVQIHLWNVGDYVLAGADRTMSTIAVPLFRLQEDLRLPPPTALVVHTSDGYGSKLVRVLSCRRVRSKRPASWIVPVFSAASAFDWADGARASERSINGLSYRSSGVALFLPDPSINSAIYASTASRGADDPTWLHKSSLPKTHYALVDFITACAGRKRSVPIDPSAAAESLYAVLSEFGATTDQAEAIRDALNRRLSAELPEHRK